MDPVNLILLIVVVLIGMKLRSILGFRNDDEKPSSRADAYRLNRDAFENKSDAPDPKQPSDAQPQGLQEATAPLEGQPVPALDEPEAPLEIEETKQTNGRGLAYLLRVDPGFDEAGFVDGAARAYEMILTAFRF